MGMLRISALLGQSHRFIHTFCDPDAFSGDFSGDLGPFTPCFIDLACLGLGHVTAIILYCTWLHYITSSRPDRYRLVPGWPRALHYSCLAAAVAATAIPLFQLNARLAQQVLPLSQGAIAPHEWLGLLLAAASFLLLCIILLLELQGSFVISRRWLLRGPLLVVASSELVKLRFVLQQEFSTDQQQEQRWGYFFWLYVVYVAAQVHLALAVLVCHRSKSSLELVQEGQHQYMPLRSQQRHAAASAAAEPNVCPEWSAGIWSTLTFSWLNPLVKAGYKTPLTDSDIWALPPTDRVEAVESRFRAAWQQQLEKHGPKKASLFAACWASVRHLFLAALPFKLVNDASQFVGPLILNQLLTVVTSKSAAAAAAGVAGAASLAGSTAGSTAAGSFLAGGSTTASWWWGWFDLAGWLEALGNPLQNGYTLAAMLFVGTVLGVLADNQHFQRVMRAGFRLKAIMTAEVYRKVLLLSPAERSHLTAGKLFNLVSSDTNTLGDFCANAFGFMSAPLRIIITMVLLYRQLGASALIAVFCIAAAVPINSNLVRAAAGKLQLALRHSDTRAKLETELVTGIEVVKASTWEGAFQARIAAARGMELSVLYTVILLQSLMGVLVNAIPTVIPVVSFLGYLLLLHQPLTPAQAFTALSLFNILRFPLFQLPQIVTQATQARVALGRLQDVLAAAEVTQTSPAAPPLPAPAAAADQSQASAAAAAVASASSAADQVPAAAAAAASKPEASESNQLPAIRLVGDFSWDPDQPPTLTDLDLCIPAGTFVAVVGPTGSGKTSLIAAMLGLLLGVSTEEEKGPGQQQQQQQQGLKGSPQAPTHHPHSLGPASHHQQVQVLGSTAYVPQVPFILGGTVRENILFGRQYNEERYNAAVRGAQLETDFAALPGGDHTELGDRGANVSGGQKQRIAIARALYADADVVLMDDPLSALDARVGRAVAQGAIKQGLSGRTVVLATNQLQFVSMADLVVVMRGGQAVEAGPYASLLAAGGVFTALMKEAQAEEQPEDAATSPTPEQPSPAAPAPAPAAADGTASSALTAATSSTTTAAAAAAPTAAKPAAAGAAGAKLTQAESSATGGVSWAVVSAYLTALGGLPAVLLLMAGFMGTELLRVGATIWLSVWTGQTQPGDAQTHSSLFYMGVYAAISGGQLLVLQLNYLSVANFGIRAGRVMHEQLLTSLLRAPMSFFHTTPTGRIINRLTKDTADIDRNLAQNMAFAFRAFLQLMSTVVLIAAGAPFALPALVVMMGLFWGLYGYFMASMRQAKRLEAVSRSPVLSSVSEAIAGSATIRAFGIAPWLIDRNRTLVNKNAATSLLNQSLNRWVSVRLEGLGAFCTLLAALVTVEQQAGSAATMGLLLTYALQITAATSMTLRVGSMAEQTFNAVERVDEYCHLPVEAAYDTPPATHGSSGSGGSGGNAGGGAGGGWRSGKRRSAGGGPDGLKEPLLPVTNSVTNSVSDGGAAATEVEGQEAVAGSIEFHEVNMRYRAGLPLVLCGLSFKVDPGFKVGVVGRTGAGKSSLIGALFRLTEIEGGCITVDGINTKSLGLRQLRSAMALIPQVPVLFTGSIRENLAPFGGASDAALWSALRRAHLAPVVSAWSREGLGGLDYCLGEGGSPLSAGQKQLLALARALLNPAKILVLDEATANVDVETDALIQETLRSEFSDRTLLAVAHRLHTIVEADRVLVMDRGRALEYGPPATLLEDENGAFTGMVRETGEATEKFLRSMAAGDASAQAELHEAASAALVNLSLPCSSASPACLAALATNLAQGAGALNKQVNGLLQLLQTQRAEATAGAWGLVGLRAQGGGGVQGFSISGGGSRDSLAALVLPLPAMGSVVSSSGTATSAEGQAAAGVGSAGVGSDAGSAAATATLQQLKAALAATSQLQQLATAAQQLLDAGAGSAGGTAGAAGAGVQAPLRSGGFRSKQEGLEQTLAAGLSDPNSPFAELQAQLSGSLTGGGGSTPITPRSSAGGRGSSSGGGAMQQDAAGGWPAAAAARELGRRASTSTLGIGGLGSRSLRGGGQSFTAHHQSVVGFRGSSYGGSAAAAAAAEEGDQQQQQQQATRRRVSLGDRSSSSRG